MISGVCFICFSPELHTQSNTHKCTKRMARTHTQSVLGFCRHIYMGYVYCRHLYGCQVWVHVGPAQRGEAFPRRTLMDGLGGPVRRFIGLAMIIPPCLSFSPTHTQTRQRETVRETEEKNGMDRWRERVMKEMEKKEAVKESKENKQMLEAAMDRERFKMKGKEEDEDG